jgi:putative methionine-R-sulfoxide reductase with GAF domain
MRIIGEFDADNIKITAFSMNERISIKFEYNLLEQTYKFRDGSGINTLEDVQKFCSEKTINAVKETFTTMANTRSIAIVDMNSNEEEVFEEII